MDLIQMQQLVEAKSKKKDKLLGQKELLLKNLKNLGFDSTELAENKALELGKELKKMRDHYEKGESKFKNDFEHLLM